MNINISGVKLSASCLGANNSKEPEEAVVFNRPVSLKELCKSFLKTNISDIKVERKKKIIDQGIASKVEVFPLHVNDTTFDFIDQNLGCGLSSLKCKFLSFTPNDLEFQGWQLDAKIRLSKILSNGFETECTVRRNELPNYGGGNCHNFVNYVVFGFSEQEEFSSNRWFLNAPFCEILPYEKTHLEWGDIVQLMKDGKLQHSLIFIRDGLFISKIGFNLNTHVTHPFID